MEEGKEEKNMKHEDVNKDSKGVSKEGNLSITPTLELYLTPQTLSP